MYINYHLSNMSFHKRRQTDWLRVDRSKMDRCTLRTANLTCVDIRYKYILD